MTNLDKALEDRYGKQARDTLARFYKRTGKRPIARNVVTEWREYDRELFINEYGTYLEQEIRETESHYVKRLYALIAGSYPKHICADKSVTLILVKDSMPSYLEKLINIEID